ncbi:aryl-sulfate sulfotransferase [Pseudodesulfovibrio tunisiensis]|uniref:aryl-sulfate sulfotransferase n=1 Tax=Pseudodesulfovibrio tunisiensis TaxID=463192 RepID=UPI001FB4B6DA|nr:aryl-sulfate sulfotransferase [Pseudodesulfovibrio tunisiensis]
MKISVRAMVLALAITALAVTANATTTVYPTGTVQYQPDKCFNGYTLIGGGMPRLVDMNGNLVHAWTGANGFPAKMLPGGQILTTGERWQGYIDDGISVKQLDWDNNIVWEYRKNLKVDKDPGNPSLGKMWISTQHHDLQHKGNPVYYVPDHKYQKHNGKTLILGHKWHVNRKLSDHLLMDDAIFEIDENGRILWQWTASDHFDEFGFDQAARKAIRGWEPKPGAEKNGFDWWHQNCATYLGPNPWYDRGDQRFHPDNIILDSREANVLCIISKRTGKVVWRLGPDYVHGEDAKVGQIIGPHNTHMIPRGLPGEGHVMVYDNGGQAGYGEPNAMGPDGIATVHRFYSRVVEIDPMTREVVWEYSIKSHRKPWKLFGHTVFSPFISSAQRLPNGNTLICEGASGRFIEVTREGEIVWEYISPYPGNIPGTNYVYRAYRVPYEWAPKGVHAPEVGVTPPANGSFQLPNDNGELPNVGKLTGGSRLSNVSMSEDAEEPDEEVNTMPVY